MKLFRNSEKALKMLLSISGNINPKARLSWGEATILLILRILLILFVQVMDKHLRMSASINF